MMEQLKTFWPIKFELRIFFKKEISFFLKKIHSLTLDKHNNKNWSFSIIQTQHNNW